MENQPSEIDLVGALLIEEIFKALGKKPQGSMRRFFGGLFTGITRPAAQVCVQFDHDARDFGFCEAARRLLLNFTRSIKTHNEHAIPPDGPVLILGNHPGTCDSMLIIASAGREDVKFISGLLPPVRLLPNVKDHFITTSTVIEERAATILKAYHYLKEGHVVVLFPSGKIDPDPIIWPDVARDHLKRWSSSVEIFIRRVPGLKTVLAISSGLLARKFAFHPVTWLRRDGVAKRRLAEFLQVFNQLLLPGKWYLEPCVTYSQPFGLDELAQNRKGSILHNLVHRATRLMQEHMHSFYHVPMRSHRRKRKLSYLKGLPFGNAPRLIV